MKALLSIGCLLMVACGQIHEADFAIRGVTVVDVTDGSLVPGQTVLIQGNRIVAVGPADAIRVRDETDVIEAAAGYLVPGLWDAHVHSVAALDWHFPLFLAHGVTSVRNMHASVDAPLDLVLFIRRQIEAGELLGPRFLANGAIVDGDPPVWGGSVVVRNAEEARAAVDRLTDGGADFIKVYDRLSPEAYFAILERAKQRGIPVDGHLPFLIRPEDAAAAGQRTFEHTSEINMGCAKDADVLRTDYARYLERVPEMPPYPDQMVEFFRLVRRAYDARDTELCRRAARILHGHGIVSVPTLVANAGSDPQGFVADAARMALLPSSLREQWRAMAEDPDVIGELLGPVDAATVENVRVLHQEGVVILAGTDVGNPFLLPGLSLHRELERLTEAGLSPLEALQAATLMPARVFGFEESLGTVETGKLADLILLDANPLQDITNTRRIRAVFADGRLFGRTDLDRLLEDAVSAGHTEAAEDAAEFAVPNDNRTPAGTLRDGVLELDLEARPARWQGEKSDLTPDAADPTVVEVLGFAEAGQPVTIPGPLIRVPQGTEVRVRVRNAVPEGYPIGLPPPARREDGMRSVADDVLVVRGLRAGTTSDDVLRVPRGEVAEVRYRADVPGTYFYWATPSSRPIKAWSGPDAQLAGAIIVDPEGVAPDPDERIFVITMFDQLADLDAAVPQGDYFRRAINGRSWPDTEHFQYAMGESVRWRWINASFEFHPMHLHGFHFQLAARGDGTSETIFPTEERPLIVTETMVPGSTFRMEWVPIRGGNWIFHCHTLDHVVPSMARGEAERDHDHMNVEQHALDAMGGLVLGITVTEDGTSEAPEPPHQRLRLVALEALNSDGTVVRGFALGDDASEVPDTPSVPGPPLLLTRDETTEITVVNRLSAPTTIHWHGLELESVYDGVAGWGRTGSRIAPLIAPGDSFAVRITPPRAGTFIYHTHMDETDQMAQGMFGPFLVLEPGAEYDPEHDRTFVIAGQPDGDDYPVTINGQQEPPAMTFRAGETYRLRFIHITRGLMADIALTRNGSPVRWRAVAKDGADLPEALQLEGNAAFSTNTGETFDFRWTPVEPGEATLIVRYERFFEVDEGVLRQALRVR